MANALSEPFMAPFSEADPVAGQKVYRTDGNRETGGAWREGVSFVFLGAGWQLNGDGEDAYMEAVPAAGRPHTTVQTVLVRVQAEEQRARGLLARIDWKALKGLIGH